MIWQFVGQARHHDGLNGRAVGHRQRARHAQAHRADVGVGRVVVRVLAVAEHLGLERGELGVDLKANDGSSQSFRTSASFFTRAHPPPPANSGATAPRAEKDFCDGTGKAQELAV